MFQLKQYPVYILLFFVSFLSVRSQPAIDTIKHSMKQRPVLFGKIGTRNSFINNSRAGVLGVQLGVNYANNVFMGIGYNQLYSSSSFFDKQLFFRNKNVTTSAIATLQMFYFSVWAEYVYYRNHRWQLSIPLQVGMGQGYYKYTLNNETKKINESLIFVYEPSVSVEYQVLKWIGVGTDIGFRFIATNYQQLDQKLNSPTYAFKLLIYYDKIYNSLKKKNH